MAYITVMKLADNKFEISIESHTNTFHIVTVTEQYANKLIGNRTSIEVLIQNSFEFLLAREPNTSILRSFDLSLIAQYFPAYEQYMLGK